MGYKKLFPWLFLFFFVFLVSISFIVDADNGCIGNNCLFSNCIIDGEDEAKYGFEFYSDDIHLVGCSIEDCDTRSLYFTSNTDNCTVTGGQIEDGILYSSSSADNIVNCNIEGTITSYGTGYRNIINGLSYNVGVPGNADDWASYTVEGVLVWDTSNSDLYMYVNSTWQQITLS